MNDYNIPLADISFSDIRKLIKGENHEDFFS